MLVDLYVSKTESDPNFIFQQTVTFHHPPMVGDAIDPDMFDGLDVPAVITARQHGRDGRLDIFAVED